MISPESLAKYAAAIQAITVTLAVIIGGTWTLYRFVRLGTIQKAKVDLARAKRESEQQAVVAIQLDASLMKHQTGSGFVLMGNATVTNTGNRNTRLDFSASDSCTVTLIDFDANGTPIELSSKCIPMVHHNYYLRSGASIRFPFIVRVPLPGIYMITLRSPLFSAEAEQAAAMLPHPRHGKYLWLARAYIDVSAPCLEQSEQTTLLPVKIEGE